MTVWRILYTSGRTEDVSCTVRYAHNGLMTFEQNGRITLPCSDLLLRGESEKGP